MQADTTSSRGAQSDAVVVRRSGGGSVVIDLRTASGGETTGRRRQRVMGASPNAAQQVPGAQKQRRSPSFLGTRLLAVWFGMPMQFLVGETGQTPQPWSTTPLGVSPTRGQSWTAGGFTVDD